MDKLDFIINEEINKVITENFMDEKEKSSSSNSEIADLIAQYLKKHGKKKAEAPKKKVRKKANGGREYYDYDDYQKKNVKVSFGDANSIRNNIDTERTNMAAVARDMFPDHTEEGAQSQFRKIVNGERPMTKKIASKIEKYISRGKIAVK
jgi:hypothetical protein